MFGAFEIVETTVSVVTEEEMMKEINEIKKQKNSSSLFKRIKKLFK